MAGIIAMWGKEAEDIGLMYPGPDSVGDSHVGDSVINCSICSRDEKDAMRVV